MSKLMTSTIPALKAKYPHLVNLHHPHEEFNDIDLLSAEISFLEKLNANDLNPALSAADRVTIEEYKLALIKSFNNLLNKNFSSDELSPVPMPAAAKTDVAYSAYYSFLLSGLVVNSVHGFVSAHALLDFVGFANPGLMAGTIVATVVNAFSYYIYEGYILKKNLGIPVLGKSAKDYLVTFEEQIALTKQFNHRLLSYVGAERLSLKTYADHADVAARLNSLVVVNKNRFQHYVESPSTAVFRNLIVGFGAIMAAGGAFFATKALILLLAAPFLATPLGMLCVIAAIPLSVIFYYGQRSHKVYKMLNPLTHKYHSLDEKFQSFRPESAADFDRVLESKVKQAVREKPELASRQFALPTNGHTQRYGLFGNSRLEQVAPVQLSSEPRRRAYSC